MKGHLVQRSKGSWSIVLTLGRDEHGKLKQRWHTFHGTKRDAQKELAKLVASIADGTYVETRHETVAEFLKGWLATLEHKVSGKTLERYAEICHRHLMPAFGHIKLPKLMALQIEEYYARALASGRLDGKGGLSRRTVLHHHRVLNEALRQAIRWKLLKVNPADAVRAPKPERREMRALSVQETSALLQAAAGGRLYHPILVAVTTGLRRGELLALRWSDVDLDGKTLQVTRSVELVGEEIRFKQPKTAKGRRKLALSAVTIESLRQHKADQAKDRLMLGKGCADNGLVFAAYDGQVWHPDLFTAAFRRLVKKACVGHVRFHDLRHSHASQLLQKRIHPKVVSERLGHATVAITLDTYSHVLDGMQEEAAAAVDQAFSGLEKLISK